MLTKNKNFSFPVDIFFLLNADIVSRIKSGENIDEIKKVKLSDSLQEKYLALFNDIVDLNPTVEDLLYRLTLESNKILYSKASSYFPDSTKKYEENMREIKKFDKGLHILKDSGINYLEVETTLLMYPFMTDSQKKKINDAFNDTRNISSAFNAWNFFYPAIDPIEMECFLDDEHKKYNIEKLFKSIAVDLSFLKPMNRFKALFHKKFSDEQIDIIAEEIRMGHDFSNIADPHIPPERMMEMIKD